MMSHRQLAVLATGLAFLLIAGSSRAITINGESRLTERQFAEKNGQAFAEVKETFAASGKLVCGEYAGTAQLTERQDVITTVRHILVDTKTCQRLVEPRQCKFTTHDGRQSITRNVVKLVGVGKCGGTDRWDDWAVLQLSSPIATIRPYALIDEATVDIVTKVFSVSAGTIDFYLGADKRPDLKTIDECSVKRDWRRAGIAILFATDCDSDKGASGGAILYRSLDASYRLVAIAASADEVGERRDGPYKENVWSSYAVPVVGEFRSAVTRAIRESEFRTTR